MIVTETIEINGVEFVRTYSSSPVYIERDGVRYVEAVDPIGFGREYVETEVSYLSEKEATEKEYLAALAKLGVE